MVNCDKNFVYYWLNQRTFPNVKKIYLSSHPCDPRVLNRFPQSTLLLDKFYEEYKTRWSRDLNNIVIIEEGVIRSQVEKETTEKLAITPGNSL